MALALARLSLNAATQFTLIGRGLATAIASMIAHAPSACMPSVSTIIMAVVGEGNSQGAVLVRAGVGAASSHLPLAGQHRPCQSRALSSRAVATSVPRWLTPVQHTATAPSHALRGT